MSGGKSWETFIIWGELGSGAFRGAAAFRFSGDFMTEEKEPKPRFGSWAFAASKMKSKEETKIFQRIRDFLVTVWGI